MNAEKGKSEPEEGDGESENPRDWDSSWKEFEERKTSNGGVFKLPPDDYQQKQAKFEGEQVERLTSAWSNDKGFLIGAGIIGFIALFYGYVFATGGISHS